ncbi:stage V sporulation protein B [Gracilibacillus ureilyticus]|uniref:Stage V sporulation protein B n=1 Tax=Gracilibacillus ureilyticus TaxID=531814 RepID=A0A1H9RP63_9BACI|nr:stage V sporulation protein B [Gracilibacillus ureilyticus]SER73883.1 stage V sporulation protein B [Gracilibacillus ureilyticus]
MTKQNFLKGTIILIIAGMITRFLGFINRIVVARVMGEEGIGLYNMALPTLFLMYTISQIGLPIAISKRVAEADAKGDTSKIKQILIISLTITISLSIFSSVLMYLIIPYISTNLLTDSRVYYPMLAIIPIIPISAVASVIRGYFQGRQNMKPQSFAQVIEQIVRIAFIIILVQIFSPYGLEYAAAAAMIAVVIGEAVSLFYMMHMFKMKKRIKLRKNVFEYIKTGRHTLNQLLSISLPSTASRLVSSVANFLEPILVAQSLAIAGFQTAAATKMYGALTGYAIPLLFLPTFITHSLAVALVPNISEAEARSHKKLIHYRIHQAVRLSFASGAIATVILTLFADPILTYMYGTNNASLFLKIMAPCFLFMYIQFPLNATLQALDLARQAMWNNIVATVIKFVVLISLTTNPEVGIYGAAVAMCVGVMIGTIFHLITLYRHIKFVIPYMMIAKMIALIGLTFWLGWLLIRLFAFQMENFVSFIIILIVLFLCYIVFLFALQFISREELKQLRKK